jgi:hypothetical protein
MQQYQFGLAHQEILLTIDVMRDLRLQASLDLRSMPLEILRRGVEMQDAEL